MRWHRRPEPPLIPGDDYGGGFNVAIELGQEAEGFLTNVTAVAVGASIGNRGLDVSATSGAQSLHIHHSRIAGASHSIFINDSEITLYVGASKLDGPVSTTGTWHCTRCYDVNNVALDGFCQ
jgi:hypothetical protein